MVEIKLVKNKKGLNMKRYKVINSGSDDAYVTRSGLNIIEHPDGEFVRYEDVKHFLPNTLPNSDNIKCDNPIHNIQIEADGYCHWCKSGRLIED